ncbi:MULTISPECIES: PDR/VanB family oxidoreductase [Pandoraea]|uniref:Oxidoreductase n=1 Tax=Pandoraea communis TaxID=2508297 RepID=A0A5E4XUB9_9BURK|nr:MULTISPECIES: PDR/VanB family oxidoreductase [Pandoraea]ALS66632.1 oxidoreductase [Pandoraea apista]CFB61386.1 Phenoxybenzoate dioxygenase subunit beta [Pandoraea apista]VVE40051.1 oxidoreductase [Pandoraea communis]
MQSTGKTTYTVRVNEINEEAVGIRSFRVSRVDGLPLEPYEPGAHVDVTSPSGITRQYSLCGDPDVRDEYLFAVKREEKSRGGSISLHDDVMVGTQLLIGRPRNLFALESLASHTVLFAAGIGITPLLNMAYRLVRLQRKFVLHYFVRSKAHAAFSEILLAPPFAQHVHMHVNEPRDGIERTMHEALDQAGGSAHVYTCGPSPFMELVEKIAENYVAADSVHLERFEVAPDPISEDNELETFNVKVASTGQIVRVEKGVSIVEALATIGVDVDTSCAEGVCGTCVVDVVEGDPSHRDQCLSKKERASGKVICSCVSRSRSPLLILDL